MKYDLIVCGGGPSGISAAISARKNGLKVLLVEASAILGGTNTLSLVSPLMTFHSQDKRVIGGIGEEIVERLKKVGGAYGDIADPLNFCATVTPINSESLKNLYFELVEEYNIDLLLHSQVIGVKKKNNEITSIQVVNKSGIYDIEASLFIDATGDGDVAAFAGVDFVFGRSKDHLCQPMTMPFVVGNVDLDKLREAMRNDPNNFIFGEQYDFKYVGISGFFKEVIQAKANNDFSINRDRVLLFEDITPNQVIVNMTRVLGLSALNGEELTKAEIEGRKQVQIAFNFLKKYIPGFENSVLVSTPYQIGIRETRHIVSDYVMTKEDISGNASFEDSIAIGAFPIDIHSPTGSDLDATINQKNSEYEISLKVMLPKGISNLIVTGRPIGATHEAAASIRVTPVVMALGEAAGALAALALKNHQQVREVNYYELSNILIKQGMIIKK